MKEKEEMMEKMLFEAIEEGNEHNIIALLRIGVNPNVQNEGGWTALTYAAKWGNKKSVGLLLNYPGIDVNMQNINSWTALMYVAKDEKEKLVELLLKHPKIDVNVQDSDGETALMLAAYKGKEKSVELLLNHPGIDVNIGNRWGTTALMVAELKCEKCVELIKQHIKNKEEAIRSLIQVEMNNAIADLLES